MLSLIVDRVRPVGGGAVGTFDEFRHSVRVSKDLMDTVLSLGTKADWVLGPGEVIGESPYGRVIEGPELLGGPVGRVLLVPARRARNPGVVGAIELFPGTLTRGTVNACGAYMLELASRDAVGRTVSLRLIGQLGAREPSPMAYEPEPQFLTQGLLWKVPVPEGSLALFFDADEEFLDYVRHVGHKSVMESPEERPGALDHQGVLVVPPPAPFSGKLGYVTTTDSDDRMWRSSGWEKFHLDYRQAVNMIRCANWERYKVIAGEFIVKVAAEVWTDKLTSFEHCQDSVVPEWASVSLGLLPMVRQLNIFGKEEMLFSGTIKRLDYSFLCWEQFCPKGHVYNRTVTFNSLLLALEGFRVSHIFYYGMEWKDAVGAFKERLETGDLVTFFPEHVNYLAHAALCHFFNISTGVAHDAAHSFKTPGSAARVFAKCLSDVVTTDQLRNDNFSRKFEAQWKSEITYSIGKRKGSDDKPFRPAEKIGGSSAAAAKSPTQKPGTPGKATFRKGTQVCWMDAEQTLGIVPPLKMEGPGHRKQCRGTTCRLYHLKMKDLPPKADLLENIRACRILTAADQARLESVVGKIY